MHKHRANHISAKTNSHKQSAHIHLVTSEKAENHTGGLIFQRLLFNLKGTCIALRSKLAHYINMSSNDPLRHKIVTLFNTLPYKYV